MQKIVLVFIATLLSITTVVAQDVFKISGSVKDKEGNPVASATVNLMDAASEAKLKTVIADTKGTYEFDNIASGQYKLQAEATDFLKAEKLILVTNNIEKLELVASTINNNLKEVTVSSKRPNIETGLGKTTVNIDPSHVAAGANVIDLLRTSPGVHVEGNNITVHNTGVLVLVDDKQTYLSGQELTDYLRTISADQVAQLEIIDQPSSRYDAEGSGGIINIKMRKQRKRGTNGSIALQAGSGMYPNTHDNANLTFRNNKLTVFANAGYLHATGFQIRSMYRKVTDPETGVLNNIAQQHSFQKETFEDYNLRIGTDYAVNDKLSVGGSAKGIYHPNHENDATTAILLDNAGTVTYNNTTNSTGLLRKHAICNAYAKYKPAKDQEINLDIDYLARNQVNYQNVSSKDYNADQQNTGNDLILRNHSPSEITATVAKLDYSAKLKNKLQVEAGAKYSISHTDNGAYFERLGNNSNWQPDPGRTNDFIYRENINAAYTNVTKDWGKQWQTQLGLRLENLQSTGKEMTQGQAFMRNNTSLFPTLFASYKMDEHNSFELNCGRRVNRPAYTQLNPFIYYFSQYNFFKGNPDLKASYVSFAELKYNYKNAIFLSMAGRQARNVITPTLGTEGKAVYASFGNNAHYRSGEFSINYNSQLFVWWLLSAGYELNYNAYSDLKNNVIIASAWGHSMWIQHQFTFGKGWSADTSFYIATGDLQNMVDHYATRYWLGFNVSKKIMKDSGTIRLSADDPFVTHRLYSTNDYNGIANALYSRNGTQEIAIGFTYNFGKKNNDAPKQRENNIDEAKRM